MTTKRSNFCINTYSYTLGLSAIETIEKIADFGFKAVELMMYPGHVWPASLSPEGLKDLKHCLETKGVEVTTLNMPNIDLNVSNCANAFCTL